MSNAEDARKPARMHGRPLTSPRSLLPCQARQLERRYGTTEHRGDEPPMSRTKLFKIISHFLVSPRIINTKMQPPIA